MDTNKNRNSALIIGIILIAIGALSLFGDIFSFINLDNLGGLIIIAVGAVFFAAMFLGGKTRGGLAVPGSILVMVGLITLVLDNTGRWEDWSYAWTLIICAVGVGILINGFWSDQPTLRKRGLDTIRDGLILFLIFGSIMNFIGVSTSGNQLLWAILLVVLGLFLLISRLLGLRKADGKSVDLFWPVIMIGVGVLVILEDLGFVPEENLLMLLSLWPVLLIVAGLGILLHGRSAWVSAGLGASVVAVLFVTVFAGGALGLKSTPLWFTDNDLFQIGDFSGERISGSGNVITEHRQVSGFDQVVLTVPATLVIQQGQTESLTVSGDDNILPLLVTDVSGGKLIIRYKPNYNVRSSEPVELTLTVKNLEEIQNSSSGKVTVGPVTTGDFRIRISSSGDIDIEEIQADRIGAEISSSGDIAIKGNADELDVQVSSSGSFQADDLQVQKAVVRVSSSGNVTVWVVEDLDVRISSSGNVAYYGSPEVSSSLTSSGRVVQRGEK